MLNSEFIFSVIEIILLDGDVCRKRTKFGTATWQKQSNLSANYILIVSYVRIISSHVVAKTGLNKQIKLYLYLSISVHEFTGK